MIESGQGFEVEAKVKKEPNDWGSGTGCHGRGMGMHPTLPLPLLFLPCLPAAELKDNKNKANPLDTTNPEGKKRHSIKYCLYKYI